MNDKEQRVKELEDRNGELAKEILLNESAVYQAESEVNNLDTDLIGHPKIQQYINQLKLLIERLKTKNKVYKQEIFENELVIKKLKEDE
jgi:hypothetical protein